jgi:hypothetical protein
MRRSAIAICALALAALGIAPAAEASVFAEAKLDATDGYRLRIEGFGGEVAATAERAGSGATYAADGKTRHGELGVDLGRFGRIDLEFEGEANRRSGGRCRRVRKGTWTGTVQFVAERGFTRAFATEAKGRLMRFRPGCGAPRERVAKRAQSVLTASHVNPRDADRYTILTAIDFGGLNFVSAARGYREDGIEITNFAEREVGSSDLRINADRGRAFVRADEPFAGSATFREGADRRDRWHGDLTADLPGAGTIALAGRRFRATIGTGP